MKRNEIREKITTIFHDVFNDDSIVINDSTTSDDIEDWDSLSHFILISEIENAFNYKFSMKEVLEMKNTGEMIDILMKYQGEF